MELRDYQIKAVSEIRAAFAAGHKRVLYVLPTGGGKTFTFTAMAKMTDKREKRSLTIAHRETLISQAGASFDTFGIKYGLIKSGIPEDYAKRAQLASVWSLIRRLKKIEAPDLIIVDEAHHANAGSWQKVLEYFPESYCLGVTATPCRTDGKGLGEMFDVMIQGPSIKELIKLGNLVEPVVYSIPSKMPKLKVSSGGDYTEKDAAEAVELSGIIGDAPEHYKKYCSGVPAVAFCVNIKHTEKVAESFRAAGYTSEAIHGNMAKDKIADILQRFSDGKINVLTSCNLISEGTDIPKIGCAILLRPTASLSLYLQQVGRALRPCDGKEQVIILDHVGNCRRHGLPTEDRDWSLNAMHKTKQNKDGEAISVKTCLSCYVVTETPADVCRGCGQPFPKVEQKELEEIDGELVKLQEEQLKKEKRKERGRASTLEELWDIKQKNKYKAGWLFYMFSLRIDRAIKKGATIQELSNHYGVETYSLTGIALKTAVNKAVNTFISLKKMGG